MNEPTTRQGWHMKGVKDAESYAQQFSDPAGLARRLADVIFDWRDPDGGHNAYARGFIGRLSVLLADRLEAKPIKPAA